MSKLAAGTRILAFALLAVLFVQRTAAADDEYQQQARPAARQNQRPALRGSTTPNYARSAAFNRSVATSPEPVEPQRRLVDPMLDPFGDEEEDGGPEYGPGSPQLDGRYRPGTPYDGVSTCDTCDQCGGNAGCGRCCQCGLPGRFWVRDEYLGFWTRGASLPVLATTSPTGTLPANETLFGGNTVNGGYRSGNWIQAGMWLDCCRNWGLQADYFFLGQASTNYFLASDGSPLIARPYTDANTGLPGQELVANPGQVIGSIAVTDTTTFQGAGINLLHNLCCWSNGCTGDDPCCCCVPECCRLDLLTGFRYYNLGDNLGITDVEANINPSNSIPLGTVITQVDSFRTSNNFYGGTLGLSGSHYRGRWVTEGTAQVALGGNAQKITINGSTVEMLAGQPNVVNKGGFLALTSNIGSYSHTNFAAIPQISGRLGYRLTQHLTAFVGYTFIYWGQVARAGNQVNTTINPNLLPPVQPGGPAQPAFTLHETSFWAQGITIGGQLNF